jgi:hypothetical protein
MSNGAWGDLSDQAIAAAGVVYFIALLVHLAEWASLRERVTESSVATTAEDGGGVAVATGGPEPEPAHRVCSPR